MRLIERLTDLQIRRPYLPIAAALAVTLVMAAFASRLELRTRYEALLPDNQPTVRELRRVESRTSGAQHVLVVLEGDRIEDLRAMGDALVPKLLELGPDVVTSAEDGIREARAFLQPRAGLFLDERELERLDDDVSARWDWEVTRETGEALDDSPPPPLDARDLEERLERAASAAKEGRSTRDFPNGYYQNARGTALVVVAQSPIAGGDLERIGAALRKIEQTVDRVRASRPAFGSIRVGYAGDMPTGFIEYGVVKDDLLSVGALGVGMVLAVVLLYFMRLRALFVMGVTIAIGLVWTFGLTALVVGHLNIATGFLVSIVAGNGINVGILYQARYFEERRGGAPPEAALRTAVRTTWQPTIIAAVAAAASYGSLLVSDFRAFRHFGFIAAAGMLLCWAAKTLMVPPLLLLLDRKKSMEVRSGGVIDRLRARGGDFGSVFARIIPRAPRVFLTAATALTLVGAVTTVRWLRQDPMEYDLRKVQNDRARTAELHRVWDVANDILGGREGAMVLLADTPEEAKELDAKLRARFRAAPADAKPFVAVDSVWAFVPDHQEAKIPHLLSLSDKLERAHARGLIDDAHWTKLEPILAKPDLAPFGVGDLPPSLLRPFTEKNGTRGTLVFVQAAPDSSEDLKYLLRYSSSFREITLDTGKVVHGSGRAVVFADILAAVVRDVPKAVSLSLGLTLVVVFFTFRRGLHSAAVIFALLVGIAGIGAFLYLSGQRLNFLNFAALPITFGIGVDYAVNVAQRHHADGRRDVLSALRTTGGAVVLCSLTTIVGYLALIGSHNQAIRSLGTIAVVGELSCLFAAVIALPALLFVVDERAKAQSPRTKSTA